MYSHNQKKKKKNHFNKSEYAFVPVANNTDCFWSMHIGRCRCKTVYIYYVSFPQNINVDDIPTGSFSLVEIIKLLNVTRFDVKSINLVKVKNDIKKV